jgi:hypothetical protein
MNTFIEIWKARNQILEGIKNRIFTKEHIEEIAKNRLVICNDCDFIGKSNIACIVPGTAPCCSKCGCCLELKTRSLSSDCPEGKWNAIMTEEEEDLLNQQL